jgi:hypothetical protein
MLMERNTDEMISPRARQLLARLRAIDVSSSLVLGHLDNVLRASMDALRKGEITECECSTIVEESHRVTEEIRAPLRKP